MKRLGLAIAMGVCAALDPAHALDCRFDPGGDAAGEARNDRFFPRDDVFRPLLADPKEPRFSAGFQRVRFRTGPVMAGRGRDTTPMGWVAAGTTIGLWSRRAAGACDGVQIGLLGGVMSQFDLGRSSGDLINSDFLVGVPVTARHGRWSARLRLVHQSSHLGDEFLVRNRTIRVRNFGFEWVDLLASYEFDRLRLYGGLGAVFHSSTSFDPGMLQAGAELRSAERPGWAIIGLVPRVVFAVDFRSLQQQGWGGSWNFAYGLEWSRPGDNIRLRVLGTALSGHFPFAQFFDETRADGLGLTAQFDW